MSAGALAVTVAALPPAAMTIATHGAVATGVAATAADGVAGVAASAAPTDAPAGEAKTATVAVPAKAPAYAAAPSAAGAIGSTVFALLLIVGLILALGWLARRLPGARAGGTKSALRVVASVSLGQRERAVVVDVAGTQLLLGVGPGGTRTLHTLTTPLPEDAAPPPFAQVLAQQFGKKS